MNDRLRREELASKLGYLKSPTSRPGVEGYRRPNVEVRTLKFTEGKYDNAPPGMTLPLGLHHIVPQARVREFCFELLRREHLSAFREYMSLCGVYQDKWVGLDKCVRDGTFRGRFVDVPSGTVGLVGVNDLIGWAPWNLVWGPEFRVLRQEADRQRGFDPGQDEFDDLHWFAGEHRERLERLGHLDATMKKYISGPPAEERLIRDELTNFKTSFMRAKVLEFHPDMWRADPKSTKYDPRSDATNVRYPDPRMTNKPAREKHPSWFKREG